MRLGTILVTVGIFAVVVLFRRMFASEGDTIVSPTEERARVGSEARNVAR